MDKKYLINSVEEMIDLGYNLASWWIEKILLYWELWSWKTHLIKGFLHYFWLWKDEVSSPTYTYVNLYNIDNKQLAHFDLYRIQEVDEIIWKWLLDIIQTSDIIAIEWPKFEKELWIDYFTKINIKKISDDSREVIIE